jgi:hypothetical protein
MADPRFSSISIFIKSLVGGAQIPELPSLTPPGLRRHGQGLSGSCKHENEPLKRRDIYWPAEGLWFTE